MATKEEKRARPPLESLNTKEFQKDWDKLLKSGRYDMSRLKETMLLVIANDGMPPEYLDHELSGDLAGIRDCHVGGDFLLLYKIDMASAKSIWGTASFLRAGTHSELFKKK